MRVSVEGKFIVFRHKRDSFFLPVRPLGQHEVESVRDWVLENETKRKKAK